MTATLTPRGRLLLALAFALLLIGLASVNGSVIALALPPIALLAAGLLRCPDGLALAAERALSREHVTPGTPVDVCIRVTNHGPRLAEVRIADDVCPGLAVAEGHADVLCELDAGRSLDVSYTVQGGRGEYRFRRVTAVAGDGLGLFQISAALPAPGCLLVRPDTPRVRRIGIRPPRTRGFAGPIPSGQGGVGIDFFSLREYQAGDRLRWLNWKANARRERELYTNVFEQERVADVGLILDAREHMDVPAPAGGSGAVKASLFEYSVQAAAELAETFLADGNRVGLLVYGWGIDGVFPGYGHAQRERIMRLLARARTGHNYALETLDRLPTRMFPAQSQVVFISPIAAGDGPVLARLRAHGYAVMVVSPDPDEFVALAGAGDAASGAALAIARRIAGIERQLMLDRLRRVGAQVVNWPVGQPLDAVVHAALARQPVHRLGAAGRP